jgi:uncharacterized membrane protein YgaE (UPF0421/DUF939 family)
MDVAKMTNLRWRNELRKLFGKRMIKTAVSVFITAWICDALNWPVIFAIIAAIVTVEPTVNSSVKRGMIRLPAAAMGAAFAMLFDSMLGQVPLAYALSAFFTIYFCHRFHWDHAIIVATLTAVNMITLTEDYFLENFFVRIGTTSIGIIVSTLVNFFVFPPNFTKDIKASYDRVINDILKLLKYSLYYQIYGKGNEQLLSRKLSATLKQMERIVQLIGYQQDEYRYHRFQMQSAKDLRRLQKRVQLLQNVTFHIGDILSISASDPQVAQQDRDRLWHAWQTIELEFNRTPSHPLSDEEQTKLKQSITSLFYILQSHYQVDSAQMSLDKSSLIAYELLAIHTIVSKHTF